MLINSDDMPEGTTHYMAVPGCKTKYFKREKVDGKYIVWVWDEVNMKWERNE